MQLYSGYNSDAFSPFDANQLSMANTLSQNLGQPISSFPYQDPFAQSGGFGNMTNYYSGLGAAYGRQTGGFNAQPGAVGTIGNPGTSNPGYLTGGGGGYSYNDAAGLNPSTAPNGGGFIGMTDWQGRAIPSGDVERGPDLQAPAWQNPFAPQAAANPFARMYRMPQANPEYFNPGTYTGAQGNYGIPYNGKPLAGDIGFSRQPSYPNLGYNPGMQHQFANPNMNNNPFQNRFGMGFPNAGTPNQYAPGAQMPPGFSPEYNADQPRGALPLNTWGPGGSYQPGG